MATTSARLYFSLLAACAVAAPLSSAPAVANPATNDYVCTPSLPKGERITIDWNSGGKSINVTFPDGKTMRLGQAVSGSGFRYVHGNVEVVGKGDKDLMLQIGTNPVRTCVKQ